MGDVLLTDTSDGLLLQMRTGGQGLWGRGGVREVEMGSGVRQLSPPAMVDGGRDHDRKEPAFLHVGHARSQSGRTLQSPSASPVPEQ